MKKMEGRNVRTARGRFFISVTGGGGDYGWAHRDTIPKAGKLTEKGNSQVRRLQSRHQAKISLAYKQTYTYILRTFLSQTFRH